MYSVTWFFNGDYLVSFLLLLLTMNYFACNSFLHIHINCYIDSIIQFTYYQFKLEWLPLHSLDSVQPAELPR